MKTKHAIIIWLIGYVINVIGALFKIQHWPFGALINIVLIFGWLLIITGFILFVYKFYKYPNKKEFLNF